MKKILFYLLLVSSNSFGQSISQSPKDSEISVDVPQGMRPPVFVDCCSKYYVATIDFQSSSDPLVNVMCNTLGPLEIKRIDLGLYTIELNVPFPEKKTWIYIQTESSIWREIQAQWQPDGKIYIQAIQNGQLTDIVTQNVSIEIRLYP